MPKRDPGVAVTALTGPASAVRSTALGVYLVLAATSILGTIAFVVTDTAYGQDPGTYLGLILRGTLPTALGASLPFAIGVFIAFWQIAPVARSCGWRVVTRSLLAAVIGAAAMLVIGLLVAVVANSRPTGWC